MRHPRSIAAFALALLLSGWRCGAPERYRLGVALGADGVAAARLAVEAVNASGGIDGVPLELTVQERSGTSSAALALGVAEVLTSDPKVLGVVGHSNSSATLAASQVYNARHVAQIAPSSTAPLLATAGPYTFQLVASDVHQADFLAGTLARCAPRARIALLYVNDDYGRGLEQALRAPLARAGITAAYEAPVADQDRFAGAELARAVAASRPEVVLWVGRALSLRTLLPPLRQRLPTVRVLASDGVDDPDRTRDSTNALEGVQFVRLVPLPEADTALRTLHRRFVTQVRNTNSSSLVVLTYDAVMIYAQALRAGARSREAIRAYLAEMGRRRPAYAGLSGRIAFDSTGAAEPRYHLTEIVRGGLRPASFCAATP